MGNIINLLVSISMVWSLFLCFWAANSFKRSLRILKKAVRQNSRSKRHLDSAKTILESIQNWQTPEEGGE